VETLFELLKEVDPKEYEKYARFYGITDYRQLLSRCEEMKAQESQVRNQLILKFELSNVHLCYGHKVSSIKMLTLRYAVCGIIGIVQRSLSFETNFICVESSDLSSLVSSSQSNLLSLYGFQSRLLSGGGVNRLFPRDDCGGIPQRHNSRATLKCQGTTDSTNVRCLIVVVQSLLSCEW